MRSSRHARVIRKHKHLHLRVSNTDLTIRHFEANKSPINNAPIRQSQVGLSGHPCAYRLSRSPANTGYFALAKLSLHLCPDAVQYPSIVTQRQQVRTQKNRPEISDLWPLLYRQP